ncbi:MAG: ABC transporter permease subunit [Candidatus Nanopelagicales bacterium]|nr:ABC transporter permease subunit [Candidatus Nanopelagicales bacterium]
MSVRAVPNISSAPRVMRRSWLLAGLFLVWVALSQILKGRATLEFPVPENSAFTAWAGEVADSIRGNRSDGLAFKYFFNPIREFVNGFVNIVREFIAIPNGNSSIPVLGWLGVISVIGFVVFAVSNIRMAFVAIALTFTCGALGLWTDSMDTLAMTFAAVILSLAIGIPIGIWAGISNRVLKAVTPILDLAQILPTLVYLAPLALVFLIGPASATIATMVYSIPIAVRLTAFGIRGVPTSPVEAGTSMGTTKRQLLRKVQLPMSSRTIIMGINQTVMAALSFVVIAALIGAPGLGKPVLDALIIRNVGDGFVAGIAVVLIAIMLDRSTSAAITRKDTFVPPSEADRKRRKLALLVAGMVSIVGIILSRQMAWAAFFPEQIDISSPVADASDSAVTWVTENMELLTTGLGKAVTVGVLNPLEGMLANSPWYLTIAMITLSSLILGGIRSAIVSASLLLAVVATGLWYDTMITFTQTIVATLLTMIVGVVLGVWIGRNVRAERALRPVLDAGQTLPAFVYLIPMLGFFGPSRFTAIATGIVYSIPIVVKIVGQGIRDVPVNMVEAATSTGSTKWQLITKVQLPAAKKSLLLATNQGLIFVLAVVVIGGFVGGGGLGYLVLLGASKPELQGKGLAAGFCILLLGVMIDRIAQYMVARNSAPKH